jgi:hypothetical protein
MRRNPFQPPEPTVEELLSDPITKLLMARDRLRPEVVWACVRDARRKLKERAARESARIHTCLAPEWEPSDCI